MSSAEIVSAINALLKPRQRKTLSAVEPRGALRGKRASVLYKAKSTGGIASPLTERTRVEDGKSVPDRDYYTSAEFVTSSTDGMLSFVIKPIRTSRFVDANGALEEREHAQPG